MINPDIRAICQAEGLAGREITPLTGGQVNQVFLVDGRYVLRIGAREDAYQRMERETELLRNLAGKVPVPGIYAYGQQAGLVYQIQNYIPGQKLIDIWKELTPNAQETIVADLAAALEVLHSLNAPSFGYAHPVSQRYDTWADFLTAKFTQTLEEIQGYGIRMAPGMLELAHDYFYEHRHVLAGGTPAQVHGDLTLTNILIDRGRIAAILDFEYALQAPCDYELLDMEAFCLYPNDYAEEDQEVYCSADFANFFQLLQKYYPALFEIPNLRARLDLYHVEATLSSYLTWRKANLDKFPVETMAGKDYYMARITNFTFEHGARMFF